MLRLRPLNHGSEKHITHDVIRTQFRAHPTRAMWPTAADGSGCHSAAAGGLSAVRHHCHRTRKTRFTAAAQNDFPRSSNSLPGARACRARHQVCRSKEQSGGKEGEPTSSIEDAGSAVKAFASKAADSLKEQVDNAQDSAEEAVSNAQKAAEDVGDTVKEAAGGDDIPDFDLPTGVAMGVCSFEAYNEPGPMIGVAEGSDTGTYKLYLDEDYLRERVVGILQVHVRWAVGVPVAQEDDEEGSDMDADKDADEDEDKDDSKKGGGKKKDHGSSTGDISPYVTVGVGPAVGITSVVEKSQQAQWRETFFLNVRSIESDVVVKLFNAADGKGEEPADRQPLASASVDLKQYTDGDLHDVRVDLGGVTAVGLSLHYTPLEDTSFEEVQARSVSQMLTDDWSGDEADNVTSFDDSADGWFDPGRRLWQTSQNMFESSSVNIFKASSPRMKDEEANRLADNQPGDRDIFKQWTGLLEDIVSRDLTKRAPPLAFVTNPATDTELWVYRNAEKRDLIFAFRGTSSPKDMITDMSVELKPFVPGKIVSEPSAEEVADELGGGGKLSPVVDKIRKMEEYVGRLTGSGAKQLGLAKWLTSQAQMLYASEHDEVWVHKGFLSCYQSVAPSLLELAEEAMAGDEQWTIYTTGHSMGGALATLFAYELAQHDFKQAPSPEIQMWGFGSPRVGNIPFAEKYDKLDIVTWRISNLNDIVTKVPSLLGFKHVGVEVRLLGEGEVAVKKGTFDEVREGTAFGDLVDGIRDGTFGEDEELQNQFREICKDEIKTAKSILKGNAMKEHMEDFYYEAVKLSVEAAGDGCSAKMVAHEAVEKAASADVSATSQGGDGSKEGSKEGRDESDNESGKGSNNKNSEQSDKANTKESSNESGIESSQESNGDDDGDSRRESSSSDCQDDCEKGGNGNTTETTGRNKSNGSSAHDDDDSATTTRVDGDGEGDTSPQAQTEDGGSGGGTGKRRDTVGRGIGKGESDRRRLPETGDDTDGAP